MVGSTTKIKGLEIFVVRNSLAACGLVLLALFAGPATADPFHPFLGAWGGTGRVVVDDGKSESIRCTGYYRAIGDPKGLGVAIRCASPSYSIQLRSALAVDGTQLSGSWEERTFNVQGQLSGRIEGGRIMLTVDSGALTAAMTILLSGSSQSIVLSTQGSGLKEVRMTLVRAQ